MNREAIFRPFGKNDIIFLVILAAAIGVFGVLFYGKISGGQGNTVSVTVGGREYGRYSLAQEQVIEIRNEEGAVTNRLKIADGYADMIDADCPDHLCVKQKRISKNHENIVCLPNQVVVTVESSEESEIDAIAQ